MSGCSDGRPGFVGAGESIIRFKLRCDPAQCLEPRRFVTNYNVTPLKLQDTTVQIKVSLKA